MSDLVKFGRATVFEDMIRVDIIFEREETDSRPPVTIRFEKVRGEKVKHKFNRTYSEKIKRGDTYVPEEYYQEAIRQAMAIIRDKEKRFCKESSNNDK